MAYMQIWGRSETCSKHNSSTVVLNTVLNTLISCSPAGSLVSMELSGRSHIGLLHETEEFSPEHC